MRRVGSWLAPAPTPDPVGIDWSGPRLRTLFRFQATLSDDVQPRRPVRFTVLRPSSKPRFSTLPMFCSDDEKPDERGIGTYNSRSFVFFVYASAVTESRSLSTVASTPMF